MPAQVKQHPVDQPGIVAGQPEFRVVGQDSRQSIQGFRAHEAATVMARLGPGVRKQQKAAIDRRVRQGVDQRSGVVRMDADVVQPAVVDQVQQARHAVDERLAADDPDSGMLRRLPGKMLAGAKADFEPAGGHGAGKKRGRIEFRAAGGQWHRQDRQQPVQQRPTTSTKLAAMPPAERPYRRIRWAVFVLFGQPWAEIRASTRSVFSQENPPSASGVLPKWP